MPPRPDFDWHLVEWMRTLRVRQADLVAETGYTKTKVSFLYNGKQPYTRDIINDVARALKIAPFELLMHPEEAMLMRRYRADTISLAAAEERLRFDAGVAVPAVRQAG